MNGKKKTVSAVREVLSWMIYLILLMFAAFLIIRFVGERTVVNGDSMSPTLQDGDNLIIDKVTYQIRDPKRYEIVVFPFRYQEDTYYIKRVIALPGETVQIIDGIVYVNGRQQNDSYGTELIRNPGLASDVITLGEDEYFVLGDNRNNSADSREPSVGKVTKDSITGRAVLRFWPVGRISLLS